MKNFEQRSLCNKILKSIFILLCTLYYTCSVYGNNLDQDVYQDFLNMTIDELLQVKITSASKQPETIAEIPASVVLITRKEIEAYGYTTLEQILENIPGLYNIDDYNLSATFGVRGFWNGFDNDDIIFLVNGINYEFPYTSSNPISQYSIPVESIDKIEVIRGPMSVVYGQGAIFGVINITTNAVENNSTNFYGSISDNGRYSGTFSHNFKKDEISFKINMSNFSENGMNYDYNELSSLNLYTGKTDGKLNKSGNYIGATFNNINWSFDIAYHDNAMGTYFQFPLEDEASIVNNEASYMKGSYFSEINEKLKYKVKCVYSYHNRYYDSKFIFNEFYGYQLQRSKTFESEINFEHKVLENLEATYNIYYRSVWDIINNFDMPSFGVPGLENNIVTLKDDDHLDILAAYSQVSYQPIEKLKAIVGLRIEHLLPYGMTSQHVESNDANVITSAEYNVKDINIIPRIGLLYNLSKNNVVKVLYGMAINQPSFFQNTKNTLDPNVGNLESEVIETHEINYIGVLSPKISINASLYRNELSNLITRMIDFDDAGNYFTWNENAGEMETYGIELTLSTEIINNLKIETSGIFQKTQDNSPGMEDIDLAYSPQLLGYLKLFYNYNNFSVGITGNYVSQMDTYYDNRPESNNQDILIGRIGQKSPAYNVLNLNFRIEDIIFKRSFLSFRITNILDTEIRYPTFNNNNWMNKGTIGYGRTITLNLGYSFK